MMRRSLTVRRFQATGSSASSLGQSTRTGGFSIAEGVTVLRVRDHEGGCDSGIRETYDDAQIDWPVGAWVAGGLKVKITCMTAHPKSPLIFIGNSKGYIEVPQLPSLSYCSCSALLCTLEHVFSHSETPDLQLTSHIPDMGPLRPEGS